MKPLDISHAEVGSHMQPVHVMLLSCFERRKRFDRSTNRFPTRRGIVSTWHIDSTQARREKNETLTRLRSTVVRTLYDLPIDEVSAMLQRLQEPLENGLSPVYQLRHVFHCNELGLDTTHEPAEIIEQVPRPMTPASVRQLRKRLTGCATREQADLARSIELVDRWRVFSAHVPLQELGPWVVLLVRIASIGIYVDSRHYLDTRSHQAVGQPPSTAKEIHC